MNPAHRLFVLDLTEGRVFTVRPDGCGKKIVATGGRMPDGDEQLVALLKLRVAQE
jgi:hypothetical protein